MTLLRDVEDQIGTTAANAVDELVTRLGAKSYRNGLRQGYYDSKNLFRDLGIAIPPNLRNIEVAMEWPAKAVDALADRVTLESFALPGGSIEDWGIPEIARDNSLDAELPQAVTSGLINSCAFILTTTGDVGRGEPASMISMRTATEATGIWDRGLRGLSSGLVVMDAEHGEVTRYLFLTPMAAAEIERQPLTGRWVVRPHRHNLGRTPLEVMPFKPTLHRPFGQSRISRAVMSITDSAMRTVVRSEVGAEFYSVPQRYLLGADERAFVGADGQKKSTWDLMIGRLLAMPDDPDADDAKLARVEVGQFPQVSMQPHTDQFELWTTRMASASDLPISDLGFVKDNPASAEAMETAYKQVQKRAESCHASFRRPLVRAMWSAIQLRDGLRSVPDELARLDTRWRDPSTPSRASRTDAVMKQVQAGVLPPDSPVTLEALGYDETTIARIMADRTRAAARASIMALTGAVEG